MRAICEQCEQPQPADWAAGDLCVHCGQAVRREVRCGWCAQWTPAATYCRECGAEVVDEALFGAARMLKDAGVDRFTIPKQLTTLDPAQVENFTRIYQRQAIVVARHVEQLRFVQRFLRQRHWAAVLDDRLIGELPWNDDDASRHASAPIELNDATPVECVSTLRRIEESTPIAETAQLAAVARLRLDDWSAVAGARSACASGDATIRDEAGLALTSWRVRVGVWPLDLDRDVIEALRTSAFPIEAGVRLAALTRDAVVAPDALTAPDPETSIGAALVLGDVDRLHAALRGDPVERSAAGAALARLGVLNRLGPVLADGPDGVRRHVLDALSLAKRPAPDLHRELMAIIEATSDPALRELAVRVAAPVMSGRDARRVVELSAGEARTVQSLLQRSTLDGDELAGVLDALIDAGTFTAGQFGMSTIVESERLPTSFVPARFGPATPDVQRELLALAEMQLARTGDQGLHRFVMSVVFGPADGELRTSAWWVLHRWYKHQGDHRGEGPLRLEIDAIDAMFGSIDLFLPALSRVLHDRVALDEPTFADFAANLLSSADAAFVGAVHERDRLCAELVDALIGGVGAARINTAEAMWTVLSWLGTDARWRERCLIALREHDRAGNYHYDKAVRRLVLAEFGIPTEDEWSALPIDFVPSRFGMVDDRGRTFLLDVAEHQLIHASGEPDAPLLEFLAGIGEQSTGEIAERAKSIHAERAPRHAPTFDRPDEADFR